MAPDGTLYVTEIRGACITAIAPDGASESSPRREDRPTAQL